MIGSYETPCISSLRKHTPYFHRPFRERNRKDEEEEEEEEEEKEEEEEEEGEEEVKGSRDATSRSRDVYIASTHAAALERGKREDGPREG